MNTLALRSAAKKAFDAYTKENGSGKKLPRISERNAEYAILFKRKNSFYAEYRKTKSEMQDWIVAQKKCPVQCGCNAHAAPGIFGENDF